MTVSMLIPCFCTSSCLCKAWNILEGSLKFHAHISYHHINMFQVQFTARVYYDSIKTYVTLENKIPTLILLSYRFDLSCYCANMNFSIFMLTQNTLRFIYDKIHTTVLLILKYRSCTMFTFVIKLKICQISRQGSTQHLPAAVRVNKLPSSHDSRFLLHKWVSHFHPTNDVIKFNV